MTSNNFQLRQYVVDLQTESIKVIALFTGAISYLVLWYLVWPSTTPSSPLIAWTGGLLLVAGTIGGFALGSQTHRSQVLIWCVLAAVVCAVWTFQSPIMLCLLSIPVIFASVLLSRRTVVLVSCVALCAIVIVGPVVGVTRFLGGEMLPPMLVVLLITVSAWLSAQKLYVALAWFGDAYTRAADNERQARDRQAELQRILKALDEANYRVERANYMLAVARDQAEEARRLKQQFAQNISHELRTPLNLIISFAELMTKSPEYYGSHLPPAYLRDLTVIYRNGCHLQTLVNDVLDLSRIEAAQMSLQLELVDPSVLVEETVHTVRSLVEARGLELRVSVQPTLPLLWVDPTRLRQILFNLLGNAVRFTEDGHVTVSVQQEQDEVRFAVHDTGVGIAPKELPRIFEEFHQVDGSTRRKQGGVGLGLAISRQLVKLHGGRIWAESEPGVGSTFFVSLPITPDWQNGAHSHLSDGAAHYYSSPNSQSVILCVTQSPASATFLTHHLRRFRILIANSLQQAEQLARRVMPQAVLIDVAGLEMTRDRLHQLASEWQLSSIPFIAAPLPTAIQSQLHAVNGYLVKPVLRQNLWDMLRQLGESIESILIVDDDRDFVHLLRSMLNSVVRRYQISAAYSSSEALALLQHRRPDLILLDLILPGTNGFQIVQQIRSNPAWQEIPIIVISAQDEVEQTQLLDGPVLLTKAKGMSCGELVCWIQHALNK